MKRTKLKRKSKSPEAKLKVKLWELCKQIIRLRHGNVCYSCGAKGLSKSNWHTGHFIKSSACSTELRYNLDNLRPQCAYCNLFLDGNHYSYGKHFEEEFGEKYVEYLYILNEKTKGKKYGTVWLQNRIEEYKEILEELQKEI